MKKVFLFSCCFLLHLMIYGQTVSQKLLSAYNLFMKDPQLKYAISSLYVIDAATGQVVFDKNSRVGLADASTQKIITSATAFELLGKNFQYKTTIGYDMSIENNELTGNLYIKGDGDPTLGSNRWKLTKDSAVLYQLRGILKKNGISKIRGDIWFDDFSHGGPNPVPGGWIWEDIGNYYGAGAGAINWKENQYELLLKPGERVGDPAEVIKTEPELNDLTIGNFIRTGKPGSGDNGYIYTSPRSNVAIATGTIPAGTKSFSISGSMPNPSKVFAVSVASFLEKNTIPFNTVKMYSGSIMDGKGIRRMTSVLDSLTSPPLDSINYWFLKKSINLYGEALLKTLALTKYLTADTDSGIMVVKDFWKQKGIDPGELNLYEGSGLSPMNRVTTHAQVEVLKYAKRQNWFSSYLNAFPEYNGMSMKSGSIGDVKGFAGYHTAKNGKTYIFSFLVNNYNGNSSSLVSKMYTVLNQLK